MSAKPLKFVYFIYGPHQLLLKDALKRLTASVSGGDAGVLDVVRFHAREDDVERILTECQTLSFFGGKRLVIVADPLSLKADAQKRLAPYIENPNPQTFLVLTQETDGQTIKRLKSNALFKLCVAAPDAGTAEYDLKSGVGSWIKSACADRGKICPDDVVKYLIRWVGQDLDRLSAEVAKICDAAGQSTELSLELSRDVVVTHGEADLFDYIGAVIDRDREKALTLLESLLDREAAAGNTFASLERQFQLILRAKVEQVRGNELAKALGVSSGQAYYLEKQIRLYSPGAIRKALELLVDADYARKSSPTPTRVLLETLTVDLCALS